MAKIEDTIDILYKLEFSNPKDALEINKTENGYTFMGIYQEANPSWDGWKIVQEVVTRLQNKTAASVELYNNKTLLDNVVKFYKKNYWDIAHLDQIDSQHTASEIFIFGVNVGMKKAIKVAQEVVGFTGDDIDGVCGPATINAINAYNDLSFDAVFDIHETAYYQKIVEANPSKKIFLQGWKNRAMAV